MFPKATYIFLLGLGCHLALGKSSLFQYKSHERSFWSIAAGVGHYFSESHPQAGKIATGPSSLSQLRIAYNMRTKSGRHYIQIGIMGDYQQSATQYAGTLRRQMGTLFLGYYFGNLIKDSHWFRKRPTLAIGFGASGSYETLELIEQSSSSQNSGSVNGWLGLELSKQITDHVAIMGYLLDEIPILNPLLRNVWTFGFGIQFHL